MDTCRFCGRALQPWESGRCWCPAAKAMARTIPHGANRTPGFVEADADRHAAPEHQGCFHTLPRRHPWFVFPPEGAA